METMEIPSDSRFISDTFNSPPQGITMHFPCDDHLHYIIYNDIIAYDIITMITNIILLLFVLLCGRTLNSYPCPTPFSWLHYRDKHDTSMTSQGYLLQKYPLTAV
jgi:hypothetical protein